MKQLLFLFIVTLLCSSSCYGQGFRYKILGEIEGSLDKKRAYLQFYDPITNREELDSTSIKNGVFEFEGNYAQPVKVCLRTGDSKKQAKSDKGKYFYLEPGMTVIKINDSLSNANVEGGIYNLQYAEIEQALIPSQTKIDELNKMYREAPVEKQKSHSFMLSVLTDIDKIEKEEQHPILLSYIEKYSDSEVALDLIIELIGTANPDVSMADSLLSTMTVRVMQTPRAITFQDIMTKIKRRSVGQIAPLFTQKDQYGRDLQLVDFRGKYVLLDFWASWCTPCRQANPKLVEIYNELKDKDLTIIGISLDSNRESWLKAVEEDGLEWPQVSDLKFWNNEVANIYHIKMIPQNILIDPQGVIIGVNVGSVDKIGELMKIK